MNRYFPADAVKPKVAEYLDVILYSREQIGKENAAMGNEDPNKDTDYEWGVVSIKAQDSEDDILMNPITMMRNALGMDQGGSGVPMEREKYMKSVAFWSEHAILK